MNMDVRSNETRQQEANLLVQRYLQPLIERDIESWMSLWDDNFVLEFPFAPQGRIGRIESKEALSPYIQGIIKDLEIVNIAHQQIHLTQDPDTIIVEISGEGRIISTGHTFNAKYVWVMTTKNGKLVHMRDYWNPLAALDVRGGLDASKQGSKVSAREQG